jgi:hypothetical protein
MGMKEQPKTVYRTMQGKEIDMGKLINQNEMTIAVGNMRVNARGDKLGPGGKIVKTREELLAERQQANDASGGV